MKTWLLRSAIVLLAGGLSLTACKDDDPARSDDVTLRETSLGPVLTAHTGQTLYLFQGDINGTPTCTGNCATNWFPFYAGEVPSLGDGLALADFGVVTRGDDARPQTTYKGWPLYTFRGDVAPGQTSGENSNNRWSVAKADYSVFLADAQLVGHDAKPYDSLSVSGFGQTQYLTDAQGRTLYRFTRDKNNTNTFTLPNLSNNTTWPIFEGPVSNVPSSLNKADFGTIQVGTRTQVTYKGWPLYYFGQDGGTRGSTKGVSFPRPGIWPTVNARTPRAPL